MLGHGVSIPDNNDAIYRAVLHGHVYIREWLQSAHGVFERDSTWLGAACGGHLGVLQWARENGCQWGSDMCMEAFRRGHFEIPKWARENGCLWDSVVCIEAARRGHFEMLK